MEPKKVIIIGASSGLGKELALIYAAAGHRVAITGRRELLLKEICAAYPNHLVYRNFDVMKEDGAEHLQQLIEKLGGMDLLIYNAGYGEASKTLDLLNDQTTVLTNVTGFVAIVNFAFNFFVKKGEGQVAITSSVAALLGNSWAPAYSASKAFMSNYAEGLNIKAQRLKKNIVVTDLRPGFVNTRMAKEHKRFWSAEPAKAAHQMFKAIEKKKRVAYITKRWKWVALFLPFLPFGLRKRLV
ncbi:MAG: SDR family NAD(P)-dependent oxidoreductase [Flavisolibacter sp.]